MTNLRSVRRFYPRGGGILGGMPRLPTIAEVPEGLAYRSTFLTEDEHEDLVGRLRALDYGEVEMRGQTAKRTVRHYGYSYEYESWRLVPTDPLPAWLCDVRDRAAPSPTSMPVRSSRPWSRGTRSAGTVTRRHSDLSSSACRSVSLPHTVPARARRCSQAPSPAGEAPSPIVVRR